MLIPHEDQKKNLKKEYVVFLSKKQNLRTHIKICHRSFCRYKFILLRPYKIRDIYNESVLLKNGSVQGRIIFLSSKKSKTILKLYLLRKFIIHYIPFNSLITDLLW